MNAQPPRMYLESIEVDNILSTPIHAPDPMHMGRYVTLNQFPMGRTLRLSLSMDYTDGAQSILDAMREPGGFGFGVERKEWRCVFCGCPNPLPSRFCSQCGGPRGWLM